MYYTKSTLYIAISNKRFIMQAKTQTKMMIYFLIDVHVDNQTKFVAGYTQVNWFQFNLI